MQRHSKKPPNDFEVAAASDGTMAAIEIIDSRIADWKISFADTVADNGSANFFVLGGERKALAGLDFYTCGMALEVTVAWRRSAPAAPVSDIPQCRCVARPHARHLGCWTQGGGHHP